MRNGARVLRTALLAVAIASLAGACGADDPTEEAESFVTSAREALENDRVDEAVVELKNAVQAKPDHAPARLLLGEVYLTTYQLDAAEKELRRALDHGAAPGEVWPSLLRVLMVQGRTAEALDAVEALPPDLTERPDILAMRAELLLDQGRAEEARALLGPGDAAADSRILTQLARLAIAEGDLDRAESLASRAVEAEPPFAGAHLVHGLIEANRGELEAAKTALENGLALDPYSLPIGTRLAQMHLVTGASDEAENVVTDLTRKLGNRVPLAQLRSMIALERRDFETAKREAERVLGVDPRHRAGLYVAGIANSALGNDATAVSQLEKLRANPPVPPMALKALALSNLRMGRPRDALDALDGNAVATGDLDGLRLAVAAALQSEDVDKAKQLLRTAVAEDPDSAGPTASLAALQLATGEDEEARQLLAGLSDTLEGSGVADKTRLALLQLRAGNHAKALELANAIKDDEKFSYVGHTLAGMALANLDRGDEAVEEFERALEIEPGNRAAALALATLHQVRGDVAQAEAVLRETLEAAETDSHLLTGLTQMLLTQGRSEEAEQLLRGIAERRPEDAGVKALLAQYLLMAERPAEALPVAREAAELAPESGGVVETLGRAQLAAGEDAAAVESFERLASLRPESPNAHFLLARARVETGDVEAGMAALDRVLELAPDRDDARVVLARLLLLDGQLDEAAPHIDRLETSAPDALEVVELSAALARGRGEWARAAEIYRRAWETEARPDFAIGLADALWRDGRRDDAIQALEERLPAEANGQDSAVAVRSRLAEYYLRTGAMEKAADQYRGLVDIQPDNPVLHNQLAWALWKLGSLDPAREHAERAHSLAPDSPEIKDTLGIVLLDSGEAEQAVGLLRDAAAARPESPDIRLHFARALVETGDTTQARSILEDLAAQDFDGKDEASALLRRIGD